MPHDDGSPVTDIDYTLVDSDKDPAVLARHLQIEINNTMGREQMTRELMGIHDELKNKELKLKEDSL